MRTCLCLLVAAASACSQEFALEPRWTPGDAILVEEETRLEAKAKATIQGVWGDPSGKTTRKERYLERKTRAYRQEVLEAEGDRLKIVREYSESTKELLKPSGKAETSEKTAIHGRKVTIHRNGKTQLVTSEQGLVLGDDVGDATFFDQVVALLPKEPVKIGATWDVDATALGEAIFHGQYNANLMSVKGKGKLVDVTGKEGDRVAKLALDWSVDVEHTKGNAGIEYRMTGTARFHVDKGRFLSLDAKGPVELLFTLLNDRLEMEGEFRVTYRAKEEE